MTPEPIQLNPEQQDAVEYPGSPLLIIAGAGTGKTRVITERVAYLLDHVEGLRPENVVALTFTNRATAEMASRIRARIGPSGSGDVYVATFHSFALRIMQEQAARLNRSRETELLDDSNFWILLRRNLERLRLEVFWKNAEPGKFLKHLIDFMSRAHDELVSVEDFDTYVLHFERRTMEDVRAGRITQADAKEKIKREREIARVYGVATELLAEAGAQTFGDVIASAVRLLQKFPDVREHYEKKFRAILVDEFQDTNVAQIELLRLLGESHQNITVVGDDDQAIYRFRGASSESFNLFAKIFPGFQQRKLTQNYRSTKRILRIANELITANPERFDPDKRLWTRHEEGRRVTLIEASEPDDEALTVAAEIERMVHEGRPYRDVAVLYRAHNHRDLLARALRRKSIPFQVVRQSVRTCPPVRDLFSLMRFVAKPSDNIACARVLSLPCWSLSEDEFVMLTHRRARHSTRDGTGRPSLYEVVQTFTQSNPTSPLGQKLSRVVAWTESLERMEAQRPALAAVQILVAELQNPGSQKQRSLSEVSRLEPDTLAAPVRRVLEFVNTWQKKNPDATLKLFLEYFDLFLEAEGDIYENEEEIPQLDAVRLLTVHAAKGLEFPVVFVLRLTQNYFPGKHHVQLLEFPNELRKEGLLPPGDFHTQEERRLCYVALTRAQQELWLVSVQKPRWKPSIFLQDIRRNRPIAESDLELVRAKASGENLAGELLIDPTAGEDAISFSRVPFWALRNRAVKPEGEVADPPLPLSASSMDEYQTCPMKFKFSHLYKLTAGPSAVLTFGAVMHECVRQFFAWKRASEKFSFEKLAEYLRSRWEGRHHVGFEDDYQEKRYWQSAVDQLKHFYLKHWEEEVSVLAQERTFEFHIDDVKVIGRVDQINEGSGGEVELIDYKTGRPKKQKDAEKSFQLSVYALACESMFKRRPAVLAFYNLENGEKVTTERSAAQMELNREAIRQIARDIRRGWFLPRRNEFVCASCEFQPLCPAFDEDVPKM